VKKETKFHDSVPLKVYRHEIIHKLLMTESALVLLVPMKNYSFNLDFQKNPRILNLNAMSGSILTHRCIMQE
jgi:hypothetical protein